MKVGRRQIFRLVLMLGVNPVLYIPLCAQESVNPPDVPLPKSPVQSFRELLALTPQERKQALTHRTPDSQKLILAKVHEYLAMKPEDRELRLRATELRWYLLPLMSTPATNRAAQLVFIPPGPRKLVKDRLAQWDRLPAATQKELLENEAAVQYFTQPKVAPHTQHTNLSADTPPEPADLVRWRVLSERQRRKICERFDQFFELTPEEKEKALEPFSEAERQQMEKTLRTFEQLPKAQREQCVQSFKKFANLSSAERQRFLKNAERWRLMSPAERQAWRDLVAKVPDLPPMPPGVLPPLPPGGAMSAPLPAPPARVTTNVR